MTTSAFGTSTQLSQEHKKVDEQAGGDEHGAAAEVPALSVGAAGLALEERLRLEKRLKRKLDFYMLPLIVLVSE